MSEVIVRYWLVESDEAKQKYQELMDNDQENRQQIFELCSDVGANTEKFLVEPRTGKIAGLIFDQKPDCKIWKPVKNHENTYMPKLSSKKGKLINECLKNIKLFNNEDIGKNFLGGSFIFHSCDMFRAGIEFFDNETIVISAKDIKDGFKWKPINGLKELKASEYWQIKENENINSRRQPQQN